MIRVIRVASFLLSALAQQRQLDRGAHVQDGGDGFVDWPGLEFLDGGVFGGVVFERVLHDQHDRFEQDAQGADNEQDGGQTAVFAG